MRKEMKNKILVLMIFVFAYYLNAADAPHTSGATPVPKKAPIKIIYNRLDGSVFEKMQGNDKFVEIVPAKRKNEFIEQNKVDHHRKIVLSKPNGTTMYSYNLKEWYPYEDMQGEPQIAKTFNNLSQFAITPNPSNDVTTIKFNLQERSDIEVSLFTISGIKIKQIFKGNVDKGEFTTSFDAKKVYAGVYVCQIVCNDQIYSDRVIIKE